MPELHQVGPEPDPADEKAVCMALSDAELTERIRAGAPPAYPATQELKRRHLPAVLTYARLCGRNQVAGNQLALQAFGLAAQEACRGIEPRGNWRHHLLMLVQRVGGSWAAGGRRDRLEPEFAAWIDQAADLPAPELSEPRPLRFEDASAMLAGFYRLPALTRGILWYSVVDEEPDATVANFLSIRPDRIPELREAAQNAMRQAYLQAYLARGGDRRCQGFRRIIDAAAQPGDHRTSQDLTQHLAECPSCTRLVAELTRMADDPRTVVAEGLLGWGGSAYASRRSVRAPLDAPEAAPAEPGRPTGTGRVSGIFASFGPSKGWKPLGNTRRPSRSVVVVAAVAAGSVIAGTVLAMASEDSAPAREPVEPPPVRVAWPAVTPSTTAPVPSPSPSRKPSKQPSRSPSPSKSAPAPSTPAPTPSKTVRPRPAPIVVGGGFSQVVNAESGLCLDIANGVMENRTDVVMARCTGALTQQWSLDSIGLLRSNADPDYCLDSRGDTDRGAGIWSCSSVNGRNGLNLLFTVDGSGVIHPRIAPDFALEPQGRSEGGSLEFDSADGNSDQRWTAGPSPKG
ncbi:ricin-type beta-trefoil lectin domain protein [Streptomyces sp. NPDC057445]|uniref:ricin-type beta-trefoil lectin domain protein n=1 Tax=Streptomyces sp. NPDC057445 TaxID=3346136 RepID=UPI0036B305C7